ncbi:hypothetical protein F0562_006669 [Nyssa sinensis]|uniref:Uncharacterized protein n=1 Tax=Nyssa sinensis TaxID=561372 RepID=A0A5J5APL1_9ASTE|nr:hypothetical protein F0562_006669 [Nyssa sinensis]
MQSKLGFEIVAVIKRIKAWILGLSSEAKTPKNICFKVHHGGTLVRVLDSSNFDNGLKILNSDVKVMDMLREYDGLPIIVLYVQKCEDPIQVVIKDSCLVAGPRLMLTYGEKDDVKQGSSDRVSNKEYGGSDKVENKENYGTDRMVNEDKVSSNSEEGSNDESWYAENIETSDEDDDILDYCEDEDLEVNREGATTSQQNRQGDCGEDEV